MTWLRTEEEVDIMIEKMVNKNSGKYITQGVAFDKNSESQMKLLKMVLMSSYSFGAMIKELIADRFIQDANIPITRNHTPTETLKEFERPVEQISNNFKPFENIEKNASRDVGNFV